MGRLNVSDGFGIAGLIFEQRPGRLAPLGCGFLLSGGEGRVVKRFQGGLRDPRELARVECLQGVDFRLLVAPAGAPFVAPLFLRL